MRGVFDLLFRRGLAGYLIGWVEDKKFMQWLRRA